MSNREYDTELLKISIKLDAFNQSLSAEIRRLNALVESQEFKHQKVGIKDKELNRTSIFDLQLP